jgi:D-aminoacyl-tRNA deacylase
VAKHHNYKEILRTQELHPPEQLCSFSLLVTIQLHFVFISSLCGISHAMKLVVQRVKSASVTVEGTVVSQIGPGLLALVGLHEHDTETDLQYCCKRLLACKLFANENEVAWRHGVKQKGLEVLCVSQFTLYGTLTKKHQPDYKLAMKSNPAKEHYEMFLEMLKNDYEGHKIQDGIFGAMMDVALVNDGPVTIVIESDVQGPVDGENSCE